MLEGYIIDYCYKHNVLVDALIELTHQCNLQCKHCYIEKRNITLSKELALNILDKLFEEGTINISFTGGEIFLYQHFEEVYKYAKSMGFIIELKTNALLIDERWISILKEYRPDEINITVYGLSNEEYGYFTGDNKGFDKLTEALNLLYNSGINFSLHVIASTINYESIINGLYKKFFGRYDLEFEFDYDILSGVEGNLMPLGYRLRPEQIVKIENNDYYYLEYIEQEYAEIKKNKSVPFSCYAGVGKICIDPDGNASSCIFDNEVKYEIMQMNWKEVKEKLYKRNIKIHSMYQKSKCYECDSGILCRICPFKTERINPHFRIEDKCKISELRHKLIEDTKEIYEMQIVESLMSKFPQLELNFEIQNYGIDSKENMVNDNYFKMISNPEVDYVVNGVSVKGSKGKSTFYIPINNEVLSHDVGIGIGHALKIIKDIDTGNVDEIVKKLNRIMEIHNFLFLKGIAPQCFRILIIKNCIETSAFNNAKLIYYPANSLFWALEVQHLERIEFDKDKNVFNGVVYENEILVEKITEYLKSLGILPFDLWTGNLLNTEKGLMLIDFLKWDKFDN